MSEAIEVQGGEHVKGNKRRGLVVPAGLLGGLTLLGALCMRDTGRPAGKQPNFLPSSKMLLDPPGAPQPTNSFPVTIVQSPDGRYLALLNNGWGTAESGFQQSIAIVDLQADQIIDNPDPRFKMQARQTYFLGLAFSGDGDRLYASVASRTDPTGNAPGDTGNGIAVYRLGGGRTSPERFIRIPPQPLGRGKIRTAFIPGIEPDQTIPYPAGLALIRGRSGDQILVADNLSDDALLLDAASGQILQRYDLSTSTYVPASYPYTVVARHDGRRGYCSLWNASQVAELDLETGRVARWIPLGPPQASTQAGSHPTAMLLSSDEKTLFVAISNADAVAAIDTASGTVTANLSALLPGQRYPGNYPNALAQSGKTLFVANASSNAVAVFDVGTETAQTPLQARGFIPTEWYPTALAVQGEELFIVSGKGQGAGPNSRPILPSDGALPPIHGRSHPYIVSLLHGSLARVPIRDVENHLAQMTDEVEQSNLMRPRPDGPVPPAARDREVSGAATTATIFPEGRNPIRHAIYIIKENRGYDQVFGDLKPGNGDPSLVMFGEDVTPNQHALARQFGIIDNFYCSGEVSGDGHPWSMAAITSDYTEKTWQIGYRGEERTYDYEGEVAHGLPLEEGVPDVSEPATGYLWGNVDRHGLTHRNYGEYVETRWCDESQQRNATRGGTSVVAGQGCSAKSVRPGDPLPSNVGQPHGSASPWPWPVPLLARNMATKPELRGHFDARFPDFRLDYPDQLRVDEFLNEFDQFVEAHKAGRGTEFPQFVILRLPNDHTAGTRVGFPTPAASVADNDLAVGRVVEAVSHSPYWDDTAIFVLEDDAQDGADHVDAHRSIALVVSKYSPSSAQSPYVDSNFYTTVSMIHTMEALLGLPPLNNNDALAPVMAPLFSGPGTQQPFQTDDRNRRNGIIYQMNPPRTPGAQASARMDFSHADAADASQLNAILWQNRKGNVPMPAPRHAIRVFLDRDGK
jgi:DNA-binding beta-propeller fold protein YncE